MKKIKLILVGLAISLTAGAQQIPPSPEFNCPPGAWCHPNGAGMGRGFSPAAAEAATLVGQEMQNDPCGTKSYAEQVYCYLGEAVSKVIACGYGKDTPQYEMCDEGTESTKSLSSSEKKRLESVKGEMYTVSSRFRPAVIKTTAGTKPMIESLEKLKRGDVIKSYNTGHNLSLAYKYFDTEGKGHGVVLYLVDKKGYLTSTFLVLADDAKIYVVELNHNKNNK